MVAKDGLSANERGLRTVAVHRCAPCRTPRLPDNDRFWITAGVSHEIWKGLKFDLSYAHIFVDRAPIDISATSGNPSFNGVVTYVGNAETQINLFSVGLRYQWDPTPANPVLYRKG